MSQMRAMKKTKSGATMYPETAPSTPKPFGAKIYAKPTMKRMRASARIVFKNACRRKKWSPV